MKVKVDIDFELKRAAVTGVRGGPQASLHPDPHSLPCLHHGSLTRVLVQTHNSI